MQKEIINLSKNTLIYGLGHILARIITFLLLPLYTNIFTPEEYGVISLAYVFMGFMSVVMHYGLDAALMKRYIQSDLTEKTIYFSSAWVSFFITSMPLIVWLIVDSILCLKISLKYAELSLSMAVVCVSIMDATLTSS